VVGFLLSHLIFSILTKSNSFLRFCFFNHFVIVASHTSILQDRFDWDTLNVFVVQLEVAFFDG